MTNTLTLNGSTLTAEQVARVAREGWRVEIDRAAGDQMARSRAVVEAHLTDGEAHYGINTGFGSLSRKRVADADLAALQQNPEFVGFWDADLATPLAAVQDFVGVLDANPQIEIVMGARVKLLGRHVDRYPFRHYSGRLFATAASLALNLAVYDTQCGAKIFRVTPGTREAFRAPFGSRWVFDVELLARYIAFMGKDAANHIYELPLMTWIDVPGSKVRPWHGVQAIWDIARIWRQYSRP